MTKLFVICGHGAGDCGAVGNGYTEADLVRKLGARIKALGGDNVTLADTSRNWYADNGISSLNIDKSTQIVELHMDSAGADACGGHVIVRNAATTADKKLAASIASIFPGRANSIVTRTNLANANRANAKGYGYRLVENGFITNSKDVKTFNSRMDEIAKAYLAAFGITTQQQEELKAILRSDDMECLIIPDGKSEYWHIAGGRVIKLTHGDQLTAVREVYKKATGETIPEFYYGSKSAPWATRLLQAYGGELITAPTKI